MIDATGLAELQRRSLAAAGGVQRRGWPAENAMDEAELLAFLEEDRYGVLATSTPQRHRPVLDARMLARPESWERYHDEDAQARRIARRYSFSDRSRYYWPDSEVRAAGQRLLDNLAHRPIPLPLPLLSQHLPLEYARVRDGAIEPAPLALVRDHVAAVLRDYAWACRPHVLV